MNEIKNATMAIYPNPAKQSVVISSQSLVNTIEITDVLGRVMLRNEASKTISNNQSSITNIEVSELPSGIYFIKATDTKGNTMNGKFIKE
jgi:hypothetical protein